MNKDQSYILLGVLVVLLLFMFAETLNPYLFLEDDNVKQFLPVMLEGCKQIFSGHFPSINLHQFTGMKIAEAGTYAILYPPTIVAYFFAHYVFGNDFLTFEIFVLIHLILGFLTCFLFLRKHAKAFSCFLGSLSFIFSGYVFGLSQGWYYILPTIIFFPLILYLNENLLKSPFKKILLLGSIRGIYFYSGNAQYFIFAMLFEFLYFLIISYQNNWEDFQLLFKKYLLSIFITTIIIFPLLYSQFITSIESSRGEISSLAYLLARPALPTDIFIGTIIFPSILAKISTFLFRFSPLHYSITLFPLLFLLGGGFLIKKYKRDSLKKISPLFWCAIVSILFSLGIMGILHAFGVFLPVIKNLRDPFKFIIFTNFFMISFGTIIFSKILEKKEISKKLISVIVILFFILLVGNIYYNSEKGDITYFGSIPLNISYFDGLNLKQGRIISVATNSQFDPLLSSGDSIKITFPQTFFLSYNFATYFELDHISGKEPFKDRLTLEKIPIPAKGISNKFLNLTTLSEYNVRYIVAFNDGIEFHKELEPLPIIYQDNSGLVIFELENTKEYIFSETGDINYSRLHNGFSFKTNFTNEEKTTINLLHKKNYVAKINGKETIIYQDNFGRMYLLIPSGDNQVVVEYIPKDFIFGILISFCLFLVLIILIVFKNKFYSLKIKFPKIKYWRIFFTIIFVVALFLLFFTLFNTSNIEKLIDEKIGVKSKIRDFKVNPFKRDLFLKDIEISNSLGEKMFSSDKIILEVDITKTLKNSFKNKKPIIFFNGINFKNLTIFGQIKEREYNGLCKYPFVLFYSSNLKEELLSIKKDSFSIKEFSFIPMNKAFFSFDKSEFQATQNNKSHKIFIEGDINFERYLNGNLSIKTSDFQILKKESCIILPMSPKNNIYY